MVGDGILFLPQLSEQSSTTLIPASSSQELALTMVCTTDWPDSETTANEAKAGPDGSSHLWEESWDDDDTNDDFAVMLK